MRRFALLLPVFATACAGGQPINEIRPDQARVGVIRTLGDPDAMSWSGNVETLTYTNRRVSGWSGDRASYLVRLTDGRVTSYGLMDGRTPVTR